MVKPEKKFKELCSTLGIGRPCIIRMHNGDFVRTTRVVNWHSDIWGNLVIETMNTIYTAKVIS